MKTNQKITAIVATIALVAILGVCLVACNADDYTNRFESYGYTVKPYVEEGMESIANWGLYAYKQLSDNPADRIHVTVVKYKKRSDAKKAESNVQLLGVDSVGRKGKIVFWGSEEAVEDVKYFCAL